MPNRASVCVLCSDGEMAGKHYAIYMATFLTQQAHHAILILVKMKGSAVKVVEAMFVPVRETTLVHDVEQVGCIIF